MARLTYVTTCKGRLEHLKQSLPAAIAAQAAVPGEVSLVVVDFSCPDGSGDWVEANFPAVQVVRVEGALQWQAARARNAGAAVAQSDWLAFFDADIVMAPDFFKTMLPLLEPGHLYLCDQPVRDAAGTCIVERAAHQTIGGYDEAMTAYGGEDSDYYDSLLRLAGVRQDTFPARMISVLHHSDEERLRFLDAGNIDRSVRLGFLYRTLKVDFFRLAGAVPLLEERRALLAAATQMVDGAAQGKPTPLRFSVPDRLIKTSPPLPADQQPRLRTWLRYELEGYGPEQPDETRTRKE